MNAEAEFFSRFFALSLIEESFVVEAIANYFKKTDRLLYDSKDKDIDSFHLKRALKCYQQQRKQLNFNKKINWEFHFLKWENMNIDINQWLQFRREAREDDFLAVLIGLVMKINERSILKVLGITEGTLRQRYSNGLNKLIEISHASK